MFLTESLWCPPHHQSPSRSCVHWVTTESPASEQHCDRLVRVSPAICHHQQSRHNNATLCVQMLHCGRLNKNFDHEKKFIFGSPTFECSTTGLHGSALFKTQQSVVLKWQLCIVYSTCQKPLCQIYSVQLSLFGGKSAKPTFHISYQSQSLVSDKCNTLSCKIIGSQ